jgi:excisionase family DNA binding protein
MKANRRDGAQPLSASAEGHAHPGHEKDPVTEGMPQRLLSINAASEYLGVSRATVERLVFRGELPMVKVGGSTRYDVEDLDGFIAINRCRNRRRSA